MNNISTAICQLIFNVEPRIPTLFERRLEFRLSAAPEAKRGLTETLQMQDELKGMFHREVDFIVKTALEKSQNWLRRQTILDSAQVIYATR